MASNKLTREELWAKQRICKDDVDYSDWNQKRELLKQISQIDQSCIFTVDVFKNRYDFASESFTDIFGFKLSHIKEIEKCGDLLEERIHPEDRKQLIAMQIKHARFIYSLPAENRNDYQQTFQFRMLNRRQQYVNITSRQQVIEKDRNGKAWIIMGMMNISPDQLPSHRIKCSVLNRRTGEILNSPTLSESPNQLTNREKEILHLIHKGFLSKEIASRLNLSIHTINNHRKNLLNKLGADNVMEAVNQARIMNILD